jgi:hypothetical protein
MAAVDPISTPLAPVAPARSSGVVSVEALRARPGKRGDSLSPEAQRILIFLLGGVLCLAFLLLLAHSMNPSDQELRAADLNPTFAPWDGTWVGTAHEIAADGRIVARYRERRIFTSTSTHMQTVDVTRRSTHGTESRQVWVHKNHRDGTLSAAMSNDEGVATSFSGMLVDGHLVWRREAPAATEMVRYWIAGGALQVEEMLVNRETGEIRLISARLGRADSVDPRGWDPR